MSTTDRNRRLAWWLFGLVVVVGLAGWIGWERDPGDLVPILTAVTVAAGIGEGSNVGKRATYKREAAE